MSEAFDIGLEEYLYSNKLCFIEWAEKVQELLPQKRMEITIHLVSETERALQFEFISE